MGEAIPSRPKMAVWTGRSEGIIGAFFVRTAHNAIGHGGMGDFVFLQKGSDFRSDPGVLTDVTGVHKPFAHDSWFGLRAGKDGNDQLGGLLVSGAVRRQRGEWVFLLTGNHSREHSARER